jgi:hypothetical protein
MNNYLYLVSGLKEKEEVRSVTIAQTVQRHLQSVRTLNAI